MTVGLDGSFEKRMEFAAELLTNAIMWIKKQFWRKAQGGKIEFIEETGENKYKRD